MSAIRPNAEQFKRLAQSPGKGAVVMLNLLKFKRTAMTRPPPGKKHTAATATQRSR
jgi:hypothetical protein